MEKNNRVIISIEVDTGLAHKVESSYLKAKMGSLKRGLKVSKKNYVAYLLTKGLEQSDTIELETFISKT